MDDWQQYRALNKKLTKLEKAQRQQAGAPQNWDAQQFIVSPTCPPSSAVYVRGGRCCYTAANYEGINFYVLSATLDFNDDAASTGPEWPYVCLNAGWYLPIYLVLDTITTADEATDGYANPSFILFGAAYSTYWGGGFVEYETAAEAEAAINATNPAYAQSYLSFNGHPLCRAVLRNNGTTGIPGQWLAVDAVNRGRSYLWGRFLNGRYTS